MKSLSYISCTLLIFCCVLNAFGKDDSNIAQNLNWENYTLILESNMFSSTRGPQPEAPPPPPPPEPDPEYIDCTGALVGKIHSTAFFEGSTFSGSRAIRLGESIEDHRVIAITTNTVVLKHTTQRIMLPVGERLTIYADKELEIKTRDYTTESERTKSEHKSLYEKEQEEREKRREERAQRFRSFFEGFGQRRRR